MRMEIIIPEADQVEARYEGLAIRTGQDGSLPAPFDLFLASIGAAGACTVKKHLASPPAIAIAVRSAVPSPA